MRAAGWPSEPFALRVTRRRTRAVDRLGRRFPRVGLDGVLADLDRTATPCAVPGEAAGEGFTWEERDREDRSWFPQGVASVRDGSVLLVSWYGRRRRLRTEGARVTVVDRSDPAAPRYRHVLLVAPRRWLGVLTVRPVPVHAGGIAVSGDLLLVADTLFGLRVFALADLMRVPAATGEGLRHRLRTALRRVRGLQRPGADAVLPQLLACRTPLRAGARRLRWSFVSVAAGTEGSSLVVGEYRRAGSSPRLARYPLDDRTGLPALDARGRCAPLEVHEDQPVRMQGVALHGGTWFATASTGEGNPGDLHVGAPGAWHRHRGVLPTGPEDLTWSRPGEELWCVSEWPGRRWVFPVEAGRWRARRDGAHPGGREAASAASTSSSGVAAKSR